MALHKQIRFEVLQPGQPHPRWVADAKRLYESLFEGFELGPEEIERLIADPAMLNVLILDARTTGDELVGFYCGMPLGHVDLIPQTLRRPLGILMPRAYFLMALGLDVRGSGLSTGALWWTYRDLLTRVHAAGYQSIYMLARCGTPAGDQDRDQRSPATKSPALDRHLHRFGASRIWSPIELTPGNFFRPMRIGRLRRKLDFVDTQLGSQAERSSR